MILCVSFKVVPWSLVPETKDPGPKWLLFPGPRAQRAMIPWSRAPAGALGPRPAGRGPMGAPMVAPIIPSWAYRALWTLSGAVRWGAQTKQTFAKLILASLLLGDGVMHG